MNPRIVLAAAVALSTALTVTSAVGLTVAGSTVSVPGVASAAPGATPEPTPLPTATPPLIDPGEPVPDLPTSPTAVPDHPSTPLVPTPATLRAAMLRPGDVGSGWRAEPVPPAPDEARAVCGGAGVVAAFPDAQRAGAALSSGVQRVQEAVSVFDDAAVATKAFAVYSAGLTCARGVIGGSKVTVSTGADVTRRTAADSATMWTLTAQNTTIVIVSARSGAQLVNLAVLSPAGKKGADAVALAGRAVARLRAI